MASRKVAYAASVDLTITLASLATSATLVTGRQAAAVDNSSNDYLDYLLAGYISAGTSPTTAKSIEVWVVAMVNDTEWPDTFGASDAAVTVTQRAMLQTYGRLAASIPTDNTSNAKYNFGPVSVASLFGGVCPRKFVVFVTHETGVNLNATGGNHKVSATPAYETVA